MTPSRRWRPCGHSKTCEQRWFAGAHGNVGGGYANDVLAQLPFRWLLRKAEGLGLQFRNEAELDGNLSKAAIADSFKDFAWGAYSMVSRRTYRQIDGPHEIDERGTHFQVNETIDASVFDYYRAGSYNSRTLGNWAKKKGVDLATINTSVCADKPNVSVPT